MPTIGLDGTRFYYEERGKGPALVLVPGTGGDTTMLAAAAGLLATTHRVITYDRRGFGETGTVPPRPRHYVRRHADDLALLVRELGAVPATFVGWSWGGIAALAAAAHHPSVVREVVLYEAPLHAKQRMTLSTARALGGAVALGKMRMHERAAQRFYRWALGKKTYASLDPALRKKLLANATSVVAELEAGTGEEVTTDVLARVKVPVSVVLAKHSPDTFAAAADRIVRLYPRARVVRMPTGDHISIIRQPDMLVDAIRGAMSSEARPSATT